MNTGRCGYLGEARTWSGDSPVRRRDSKTSPAFLRDSPAFEPDEQFVGVIGTPVDVPERVRAARPTARRGSLCSHLFQSDVTAISATVELRDPYTAGHQRRVAEIAVAVGWRLGMDAHDLEGVRLGALLHDIGKLAVPAELLTKATALTPAEQMIMREHSEFGHDVVAQIPFRWPVAQTILQHHERLDGSGYPYGCSGGEIIPAARVVAVADVVHAVAAHRPYRPAKGLVAAMDLLHAGAGHLFDPDAVAACDDLFANGLLMPLIGENDVPFVSQHGPRSG